MTTSTYAGVSRFELELEFVTLLGNPHYLHHLATTPASSIPLSSFAFATSIQGSTLNTTASTGSLLQQQNFIAYLKYLLYWTHPAYLKYLSYPESTLYCLRLLQEEKFRRDLCGSQGWDVCARLIESMSSAVGEDWEGQGEKSDGKARDGEADDGEVKVAD